MNKESESDLKELKMKLEFMAIEIKHNNKMYQELCIILDQIRKDIESFEKEYNRVYEELLLKEGF